MESTLCPKQISLRKILMELNRGIEVAMTSDSLGLPIDLENVC